jgi:hypothetical protein
VGPGVPKQIRDAVSLEHSYIFHPVMGDQLPESCSHCIALTHCRYVNFTTQERAYKASFFEYVNAFKLYGTDPVVPHYVQQSS